MTMAQIEEDADFGMDILDSMLEVEMTEEDGEIEISKDEDPLALNNRTLPPIPTFDLQSETLTYQDAYRNSMVSSVFPNFPLVAPSQVGNVPLAVPVINSGPMLTIFSKDVLPGNNLISMPQQGSSIPLIPGSPNPPAAFMSPCAPGTFLHSGPTRTIITRGPTGTIIPSGSTGPILTPTPNATFMPSGSPVSQSLVGAPSQKNFKPQVKTQIRKGIKEPNISDEMLATQFYQQLFRGPYVKQVFSKKDPRFELSSVSKSETNFYKFHFSDLSKILLCKLHCTICDKHLRCNKNVKEEVAQHKFLKVLICKSCFNFYGDGKFPCDKGDNCEIYCRWCGQGGALVCCSFCPRVFCKKCVKLNFGKYYLKSVQKATEWACFCCASKPLWPHRAVYRALLDFVTQKESEGAAIPKSSVKCCKAALIDIKKSQPNEEPLPAPISSAKGKVTIPVKPEGKEPSILRSSLKANGPSQPMVKPGTRQTARLTKSDPTPIAPRSVVTGNNVASSACPTSTDKLLSSVSGSRLIQTPVLRGETLITPPGVRLLVTPKPPPAPLSGDPSFVRVSLTTQTSDMDLKKIPTAVIPTDVQGLILRLILPDNRTHLVRLVVDEGTTNDFDLPKSKSPDGFVDANLKEAFHFSRLLRSRLSEIRDKIGTTRDAASVEAAANRLRFSYGKSVELLKELDKELTGCLQEWRNKTGKVVDVIELSDDDGKPSPEKAKKSRFIEMCKEFVLSDDSDIEILDEVNKKASSKAIVNGDLKEKYRLRGTVIERTKGVPKKVISKDRSRTKPVSPRSLAEVYSSKSSMTQDVRRTRSGRALGTASAVNYNGVSNSRH